LQKYYHPLADYSGFYTPFKTWNNKEKRWNSVTYANTLHVTATRTFSDVLFHPGGSAWGWHTDYIDALRTKHLTRGLIPAFDLSVWLFRSIQWDKNTRVEDIVDAFLKEFTITDDELKLFETHIPPLTTPWLQDRPINTEELLNIIGPPPDRVTEGANSQIQLGSVKMGCTSET
jgi:hypothetical protein